MRFTCTGAARTSLSLSVCEPTSLQGMDPVVRQVGQHIEMEPEWEAAFTLQMKLTNIITMIQEWCSTDVRQHTEHATCNITNVTFYVPTVYFLFSGSII